VRIRYEIARDGVMEDVELPFVVGVLADLSGRPAVRLPPLQERPFVEIRRDNFNTVLATYSPGLVLSVPDNLSEGQDALDVRLRFQSLADFGPDAIVTQVEPLRALLEARGAAAVPAEADRRLSAQLRAILHHPDFQRLEAAWRGLHYLVMNTESRSDLHIRVLSCTREELLADQRQAHTFEQSLLFQKVHEGPYRMRCGVPFGLLVGDFEFGADGEDIVLLQRIAAVAATSLAPFVAAASPTMFGIDRFTELADRRDLAPKFDVVEHARWQSFRDSEDSRYVALTVPRVLGRLPYGPTSVPGKGFNFEESAEGNHHDQYLWMSAAWTYAFRVTDAYARYGWFAATRGVEAGGKVEGLPTRADPTQDGAEARTGPTEVAIDDYGEYVLSTLGFLPLIPARNHDFAVFMGARSCQRPRVYDSPEATASAELSAQLNLLLCVSRFGHYLKIMARDSFRRFVEVRDLETWLNRWIKQYVIAGPEGLPLAGWAKKPVLDARIDLREITNCPGHYEIVVYLRPGYQCYSPVLTQRLTTSMRLVTMVPGDATFRPAPIDRAWLHWHDGTVARLAQTIREHRRFEELPVLADALEDAGCTDERILGHLREAFGNHDCGCWIVDALLEGT
jgi:type VI secretion system protein ImpC